MTAKFRIAKGQLRQDNQVHETRDVDYTIRVNTLPDLGGASAAARQIINVEIRLPRGQTVKDGTYALEENGTTLLRVVKVKTTWRALSPGCIAWPGNSVPYAPQAQKILLPLSCVIFTEESQKC